MNIGHLDKTRTRRRVIDKPAHQRRAPVGLADGAGKIGATPKGGVCRLTLTDLDKQGRDLVIGWAKEAGMTVTDRQDRQRLHAPPGRNNACPRS
jgi:hypothetical protein